MASLLFPDSGSRLVVLPSGRPAVNARAYLYADEALTEPAVVYRDNNGAVGALIAEDSEGRVSLRLDVYGRFPDFWGPSTGADRLWAVVNGVVSQVDADYNTRTDDLEDRVEAVETGGASDALALHKAGAETVTGEKTFAVSPVVPTPSSGTHAANKTYADAVQTASAQRASNLSDLASASSARTNLGLGTSATRDVGTTTGTVAAGDDSRLSDARTPTTHATSHKPGGSDPLADLTWTNFAASAVDGADNVAGLRTLGTGSGQAASGATVTTALGLKVGKGDLVVNAADTCNFDGTSDQKTAWQALLADIPAAGGDEIGGVSLLLPHGVLQLDTVDGDGWLSQLTSKPNVHIIGAAGAGTRIRTSTADSTGMLLVKDCTGFWLSGVLFHVIGTARTTYPVHFTTSSPGSAHNHRFDTLQFSCNGTFRKAYDVMATSGSAVIWSAMAAFSPSDVGGVITLNLASGLLHADIQSVTTPSTTLAADITSTSQTAITLTAPLTGTPSSGFTIKIGTERMFVSAGGTTTSLTVTRGRGNDLTKTTHSAGAAVTTYSATMSVNATDTVTNAAVGAYIQPAGTAVMRHGLTIGASPTGVGNLDIAGGSVNDVAVAGAAVAGIHVGNGTAANILDHQAYNLSVASSACGVYTSGGSLSVYGGQMSGNMIDFKRNIGASSPIVIKGIRSEGSMMFYEMTGAATAGSATSIENIEIALVYAEDGVVIRHLHSGGLALKNIQVKTSDVARGNLFVVASGTTLSPCHLSVDNFGTSGGNLDPFSTSVRPATIKTIQNVYQLNTAKQIFENSTLQSYFSSKVKIDGGFARAGRVPVSDADYAQTGTDMSIVYTSITAARAVTLLAANSTSLTAHQEVLVKDESGSCDGTKTITLQVSGGGTIDGASTLVINTAYGKATVYTNGTAWFTR